MSNVIKGDFKRNDISALVQAIKSAVYERAGSISVAEAIGALEIAKLEILEDQK